MNKKTSWFTALIIICISLQLSAQENSVTPALSTSNGSEVFESATGSIKILDQSESEIAFAPTETAAYKNVITPQIELIRTRFPLVASYIKFIFESNGAWFFVTGSKLKDVIAPTSDSLVVKATRIRAAVTNDAISKINKSVWDSLDEKGQAYLLMHEMLWTAELSIDVWEAFLGVKIEQAFAFRDEKSADQSVNYTPYGPVAEYFYLENQIFTTSYNVRTLTSLLLSAPYFRVSKTAAELKANEIRRFLAVALPAKKGIGAPWGVKEDLVKESYKISKIEFLRRKDDCRFKRIREDEGLRVKCYSELGGSYTWHSVIGLLLSVVQ